ncbi:MAG: tetratricopeptide repeat protein [Nostoc sp. DedSLP03]|uniref:tetratricopeptide repeat protein n=1 Tax=Nostoc sp. DedSLP03 TaxID=3075400 RepID=UPI002AD1D58C|nr:tetratricopeptide repeat protein [Nostoc sp. DedSLP03]MDZ7967488.1 tetratricopeptide repeat protein [Nostoc sp. DedSLP03]
MSLFAPAPIAWDLVEQCFPESDEEELEEIRDDKLLNLHLLQRKDKGVYQLHPLLREFFQYKLTGLEQAEELKRSFCRIMVAVAKDIPQDPILKQINAVSFAIPHIAEVANNLIEYISDDDLIWAFVGNARFYNGQGLYTQAEPWYQQCLEVTKKRLGEEHPDVATSLNNLAELYRLQGRYSEAEPLYIQALTLRRKLLGEEHLDVAETLNNLAVLHRLQGRYSEAEPLYIKALALTRKLLGDEHEGVAACLNNLAYLYRDQGRYSEAETLFIEALALRPKLLGDEHPDVAISLKNLAALYCDQGRYSEAELLYIQALDIFERRLGANHPNTAAVRQSLEDLRDRLSSQ